MDFGFRKSDRFRRIQNPSHALFLHTVCFPRQFSLPLSRHVHNECVSTQQLSLLSQSTNITSRTHLKGSNVKQSQSTRRWHHLLGNRLRNHVEHLVCILTTTITIHNVKFPTSGFPLSLLPASGPN